MKTRLCQGFSLVIVTAFLIFTGVFSAFAANVAGSVESINGSTISGWAIDHEHPDQSAEVVLSLTTDGASQASELARVKADQYRSDLTQKLGSGNHAFSYQIDWDSLKGDSFVVEAYAVTEKGRVALEGSLSFTKKGAADSVVKASSVEVTGPAGEVGGKKPPVAETQETYLGKFTTTAYCSCSLCSSGSNMTYSGTVPRANHTISADIDLYPIGTKLRIGNTVYTVEDIGSSVDGKKLDIFFETHAQALAYGTKTTDVYRVE